MHRFFLAPDRCTGPELRLSEADSHHAVRVLRLTPGTRIEILDGAGRRLDCELIGTDRRAATARILAERHQDAPPRVHLAVAILKGRAMDWLVQKATELGAAEIHPLFTERTIPRLGADTPESWVEAWHTTAVEASKQCGNAWLPRIHPPLRLEAWVAAPPHTSGPWLAAMLRSDTRSPRQVLATLPRVPTCVTALIGPEGDLTEAEQDSLLAAGAHAISLGPLTLRAETAAVAALAILQHELAAQREMA